MTHDIRSQLSPRPKCAGSRTAFRRASIPLALTAACSGLLASRSAAQVQFTISHHGPSIGAPSFGGPPITEGDILMPAPTGAPAFGPLPPPFIAISGGPAGLGLATYGACVGHPPPTFCPVQVDAISHGTDYAITPGPHLAGTYVFTVDKCSPGIAASPLAPNVTSEFPAGDAAADVFQDLGLPGAPMPPGPLVGNIGIIDGNGLVSASGNVYPGLGLLEPAFPGPGVTGDELSGLDLDIPPAPFPIYFSLDGALPNACTTLPGEGTAMANGFLPGMVLVTMAPGGPPLVYAPPALLGLDIFGPGTDDLDALALHENGIPGFQVSMAPYDWMGGATDMLLFSVRRGSAVIGKPDSIFGIPIEPGDILTTPKIGGVSPFPGIFVAAENLGLITTRSFGVLVPADLHDIDTRAVPQTGTGYCFGDGSGLACPCGNAGAPGHGCGNHVFATGGLLTGSGSASVLTDTLVLTGSGMPSSTCLYFQGTTQPAALFGDGIKCVGGTTIRLGVKTNVGGTSSFPGLGDPKISVKGAIPPAGGTRFYEVWYRDSLLTFCTPATFNFTNGFAVVWTP
jgi:hypothetical protein